MEKVGKAGGGRGAGIAERYAWLTTPFHDFLSPRRRQAKETLPRKKGYHWGFFRGEWFRGRAVGWREGNSLQEQLAFGTVVLTAAKTVFYLGCAAFILSK